MARKTECIAMLLAGGQGSRLGVLTEKIAKPAVSFGGKYRMIDFSLSNCVNSGIDTVGVLVQYKPTLLNRDLGTGAAWDLDAVWGGVQPGAHHAVVKYHAAEQLRYGTHTCSSFSSLRKNAREARGLSTWVDCTTSFVSLQEESYKRGSHHIQKI